MRETDPNLYTYAQMSFNQYRRHCNLLIDKEEQETEHERIRTEMLVGLQKKTEPPELNLGWRAFTVEYEIKAEILECEILAILTTAFFLEAYITNYCLQNESVKFTERHIDKLDPVGKWLVIPRLVSPPGINPTDEIYGRLRQLFRLRNKLTHFKGTKEMLLDLDPHNCIILMMDLLIKIVELDSEEKFADNIVRQLKSWAFAASKDKRFYPIVWET